MADIDRRNFMKLGATAAATSAACPAFVDAMELDLGGQDFPPDQNLPSAVKKTLPVHLVPLVRRRLYLCRRRGNQESRGQSRSYRHERQVLHQGPVLFLRRRRSGQDTRPAEARGRTRLRVSGRKSAGKKPLPRFRVRYAMHSTDPDSITLNEGGFKDGGSVRFMDTIGSQSVIRSRLPSIGTAPQTESARGSAGIQFRSFPIWSIRNMF